LRATTQSSRAPAMTFFFFFFSFSLFRRPRAGGGQRPENRKKAHAVPFRCPKSSSLSLPGWVCFQLHIYYETIPHLFRVREEKNKGRMRRSESTRLREQRNSMVGGRCAFLFVLSLPLSLSLSLVSHPFASPLSNCSSPRHSAIKRSIDPNNSPVEKKEGARLEREREKRWGRP